MTESVATAGFDHGASICMGRRVDAWRAQAYRTPQTRQVRRSRLAARPTEVCRTRQPVDPLKVAEWLR